MTRDSNPLSFYRVALQSEWPDGFFKICPLTTKKICPTAFKIAKVSFKFWQILKTLDYDRGCDQMESVHTFQSYNPRSNLAEVYLKFWFYEIARK